MRALGRLFLLLLLIAATIVIWETIRPGLVPSPHPPGNPYPPPNRQPYPSPNPPPQPGAQPPAAAGQSTVNLAILNVRGVQKQGARYVEVTVRNYGPAIATAAAGWCSYRCPSTGTAANNLPFLQSPHLGPGQSYSGLFSFSPCPDPRLYVECLLQPGYGFQDPNFSDNRWSGTVATR
jgi:hypothetical protein